MYAAVATDFDVTSNATQNFSTAVLPFDIGFTYHGGFLDRTWIYPPDFFKPPFFETAPGIVGVKFLKTPQIDGTGGEAGLHLWSIFRNPSAAGNPTISPLGDDQLCRYLAVGLEVARGKSLWTTTTLEPARLDAGSADHVSQGMHALPATPVRSERCLQGESS